MMFLNVLWILYINLDFLKWLLFVYWGLVMIILIGFLIGYFIKWSGIFEFMFVVYIMLFIICVIEIFGFMISILKYIVMVVELVIYIVILIILFKDNYFG